MAWQSSASTMAMARRGSTQLATLQQVAAHDAAARPSAHAVQACVAHACLCLRAYAA